MDYVARKNDDYSVKFRSTRLDIILDVSFFRPRLTALPLLQFPSQLSHDRCAAKFNVRQVSGSRETRRSIFSNRGISTRRFTIRIHPFFIFFFFGQPLPRIYIYTIYTRTRRWLRSLPPLSSIFRAEDEMKLGRLPGFICNQERNYLC